ncbi:MAG TPA: hypothetical protein VFM93_11835 [Candidatus Limnocylindria bacterium]|nr:hypothetical protein [Candidatus Limnocylindria bacterium]
MTRASPLDALVGTWTVDAVDPGHPTRTVRGRARFEWLDGREFLIMRTTARPPFPGTVAIIGRERGRFAMHYFDSRGVARVYRMTLARGVWTLWRDDPDFAQRFKGRFRDRGRRIDGAWELKAGRSWKPDFPMTYRRRRADSPPGGRVPGRSSLPRSTQGRQKDR